MKKNLIILIAIFCFMSCKENLQETKLSYPVEGKSIFKETAESSFEILSHTSKNNFEYRIVESTFKPVSIQLKEFEAPRYFADITTTTKRWTGVDGQERNIRIKIKPFDNPTETIIEINKICDDIDLQTKFYKTVNYGCCGHVNHYEIYDYENNQIIEGDYKIITGTIPDSDLKMYVGFTQETNDTTVLGTLYFTTHYLDESLERFAIKIKSKPSNVRKCETYWPGISLQSNKTIDTFDAAENEYSLWSLDKIENKDSINNLAIQFKIECTEKQDFKLISIPIINGKPFGKEDKIQELTLE